MMTVSQRPIVLAKIEQESETNHPLALLFLSCALRKSGYQSKILLERTGHFDPTEFARQIASYNPLFVGLSSITGRQCYDAAVLARAIRDVAPEIPLVWGGIHTSLVPEQTLQQPYVDFIVGQEGEETIVELARALESGARNFHEILGLGYKVGDRCVINDDRPYVHLPDYELEEVDFAQVDMSKCIYDDHSTGDRLAAIQTSRGCPFNCGFCYSVRFTKRKMRYFEPDAIKRMGRILNEKYGVNAIMFTDDNIYFKYERMREIAIGLKEVGIYCRYLQTRVEDVTEESLRDLHQLGVRRLFFGIETGSLATKILIAKKIPNELILEKIRLISKFPDMGITCALIVGFPTETEESINETIQLAVQMTDIHPNTVVTLQTFVPFPGTDLYQLAVGCGYDIPNSPEEYGELDSFDGDIDIKWSRYYDLRGTELARRLNLMNKYAALLTHSPSTSMVRTLGKKVLRHFARQRLLRNYYEHPFEIGILGRFNRYMRHYYKDRGGVGYLKNRYQVKSKKKGDAQSIQELGRDVYSGAAR